ncbi:MAG: hypothetical protein WC263_04380 [Candidatus Micrarchaeia archaeon]|jgi:hypothetical protein
MAKKKSGARGTPWNAWVWAASNLLHIPYYAARLIIRAADLCMARLSSQAKEAGVKSLQPKAGAAYSQLAMQGQAPHTGSLEEFEQKIMTSKSAIGLVLGARGSGKSALGMRMLENVSAKTGRQVCAMGFDRSSLPGWINAIGSLDEVPNGAFVLVDEGGISFSSRSAMSSANRLLSSLLFISRHKDISVLFISQNSANLEVNAIRQADFLMLRKPSLLQSEFERGIIAKIYKGALGGFEALPGRGRHSTYIYSDEFRGFAACSLPSFWSEKASKGYGARKL